MNKTFKITALESAIDKMGLTNLALLLTSKSICGETFSRQSIHNWRTRGVPHKHIDFVARVIKSKKSELRVKT